jgi:L-lactate utilization protein LutC
MKTKSVPVQGRPDVLPHPYMEELQRRARRARKAARHAARLAARIKRKERKRLNRAISVMAHNYQVHPVYPSDDDDLEWINSTPELDRLFPLSYDDVWDEVYYSD